MPRLERLYSMPRWLKPGGLALALASGAACVRGHALPDGGSGGSSLHAIAFIEDDYPRALAVARSRNLPLFVDAWASWCHSCLSLRAYVFPDPTLRPFADRFVWLSLDTEREANAPVVAKLDVHVLPTLYVIDPGSEREVLRWPGSLTAAELTGLLADAEAAVRHPDAAGAATALLLARRAGAAGAIEDAIAAYRAALQAAPPGWPDRPFVVDALVTRLSDDKRFGECVTVAAQEGAGMPAGTALADVLCLGMGCAEGLAPGAPERARLTDLVAAGRRVAGDLTQPLLADDRSSLYDSVVGSLRSLGRAGDLTIVAREWAAFLAAEAGRAPDPRARAVFDAHRLLAYRALGEPERAVPMLEQSERDFPDDYNPPARLATAFFEMRRYDDALRAAQRALDRAYGPRKLQLWSLEADVLLATGDREGARRSLREALDFAATTPLTGSYPQLRDTLFKRLAVLK